MKISLRALAISDSPLLRVLHSLPAACFERDSDIAINFHRG